MKEKIMKHMMTAAFSIVFAAALSLGSFAFALDMDGRTFTTAGDNSWYVKDFSGYGGGAAAWSDIADSPASSTLSTVVNGLGTLTFWTKIEPGCSGWLNGYMNLECDGDKIWYLSDYMFNVWTRQEAVILEEGEHQLDWQMYMGASSASMFGLRMGVSAVTWTPAPESITVIVDAGNGEAAATNSVSPGATYADLDLPTPVRAGWTFSGWRVGSPDGAEMAEDEFVPLKETVVFAARWTRAISNMKDAGFTYATGGTDKFVQSNVVSPDGRLAAVVDVTRVMSYGSSCSDSYSDSYSKPYLAATVKGPLFLTFKWKPVAPERKNTMSFSGYIDAEFLLDGNKVADCYAYNGAKDWEDVHVYVPSGTHKIRWNVAGEAASCYEYYDDETEEWVYTSRYVMAARPSLYVADVTAEKPSASVDINDWMRKFKDFKYWTKGEISKFNADFHKRFFENPGNYEARIFHAAGTLAILAENAEFQKYAKTFGLTFDYTRFAFTGAENLSKKTAGANVLADRALAIGTPAINKALEDLDAIPENWTGTVMIKSDTWPVDEDVHVDIADVMFAKSSLKAMLATLNYLAGYDLTIDWTKFKSEKNYRRSIPSAKSVPSVDDAAGWSKAGAEYETSGGATSVRAVRIGDKLVLRAAAGVEFSSVNVLRYLDWDIVAGGVEYNLYFSKYPDGFAPGASKVKCYVEGGKIDTSVTASLTVGTNAVMVVADLSKIRALAGRTWTMEEGSFGVANIPDEEDEDEWGYYTTICEGEWEDCYDGARLNKFLNEQTRFFSKVRDAARLTKAKSHVRDALRLALKADALAQYREDDFMHFVEYDPEMETELDIARSNTELALDSLDKAVYFDVDAFLDEINSCDSVTNRHGAVGKRFDCTLLPDNGVLSVYLGALFEGRVTRSLKPATTVNSKGRIVVNPETIPDPTFAGLFQNVDIGVVSDVADMVCREVAHSEWKDVGALPVPGTKVALEYSAYVGYDVKGLPKGWTWNKSTGKLTGTASSSFALTFTKGKTVKKETVSVGPKPSLVVTSEDIDKVTVTGTGLYAANTKVKIAASVKRGYAFGGWYTNGVLFASGSTATVTMPAEDLTVVAAAVPLEDDCCRIEIDSATNVLSVTAMDCCGGAFTENISLGYVVDSCSPVSVSASGLPPGVRLDIKSRRIEGRPTKTGVFYVTLTAKSNGGFVSSDSMVIIVGDRALPSPNEKVLKIENMSGFTMDSAKSLEGSVPALSGSAAKTVKLSGLPAGLKATFTASAKGDGTLRISGMPTKSGIFPVTATVTYASKKTAKTVFLVSVTGEYSQHIATGVVDNDPLGYVRGTASGGGVKRVGSALKLVAKSANAKKYFFGGWYKDEDCQSPLADVLASGEWRNATMSFTLANDLTWFRGAYARFVTKDEDGIWFDSAIADDVWLVVPESGVYGKFDLNRYLTSQSLPSFTAKGLPAGTKLSGSKLAVADPYKLVPGSYVVTVTAKNASGNYVSAKVNVKIPYVSQAADKGVISGLYFEEPYCEAPDGSWFMAGMKTSFKLSDLGVTVAKGWTLSVVGLPAGWTYNAKTGVISGIAAASGLKTVSFIVKKGKTSYKATATFDVEGLPDWVKGTFHGGAAQRTSSAVLTGPAKVSVSAGGKISGSLTLYSAKAVAKTVSFSGTGFSTDSDSKVTASVSGKLDGKTVAFRLSVDGCQSGNGILKLESANGALFGELEQNCWGRADKDDFVPAAFPSEKPLALELDYSGDAKSPGLLTLKFGANGAVTCVYTTAAGSVTGSAQLAGVCGGYYPGYTGDELWTDGYTGTLYVMLAPNAAKGLTVHGDPATCGFCRAIGLSIKTDESGTVTDIRVESDNSLAEIPDFSSVFGE